MHRALAILLLLCQVWAPGDDDEPTSLDPAPVVVQAVEYITVYRWEDDNNRTDFLVLWDHVAGELVPLRADTGTWEQCVLFVEPDAVALEWLDSGDNWLSGRCHRRVTCDPACFFLLWCEDDPRCDPRHKVLWRREWTGLRQPQ